MTLRQSSAKIILMYELTYILNPNLSESEAAAQTDKARGFINALGGEIKNESIGEKRRLAYQIKKQNFGFYVTVKFNLEPENVSGLQGQLRLEPSILRHLLIIVGEKAALSRKVRPPRPKSLPGLAPAVKLAGVEAPAEKIKIEEIDKKLEEILEE